MVRSFEDFLRVDVWTGDSDPVYWAVSRAFHRPDYGPRWATRFSVAMLAYYNTGLAFIAAELPPEDFWEFLNRKYDTASRGSERRHFRGTAGRTALARMEKFSPDPHDFFTAFCRFDVSKGSSYEKVAQTCEKHLSQFGPYFQLKICDYMDRCLELPIHSYAGLEHNLPTEPARAVALMYPDHPVPFAFKSLCEAAAVWSRAAPDFERPVGPAEVETSLCGWKTTKYKGNWFGADIEDKRLALIDSGVVLGEQGDRFLSFFPDLVPRGTFKCEL